MQDYAVSDGGGLWSWEQQDLNSWLLARTQHSWQEWQKYLLRNKPRWDGLKMLLGESLLRYTCKYSFEANILLHVRPLQQLHFLLLVPANKLPLSCRAIKDDIRRSLCKHRPPVPGLRRPVCSTHASRRLAGDGDKQLQSATWGQRRMTQGEKAFFCFPRSQNVLSQFWSIFQMGIQRCGALLIRLLCQVALHLSRVYCSTGEGRGGWRGGCRVGILTHSAHTSCTVWV